MLRLLVGPTVRALVEALCAQHRLELEARVRALQGVIEAQDDRLAVMSRRISRLEGARRRDPEPEPEEEEGGDYTSRLLLQDARRARPEVA